jgi:hypothetical protein
MTCRDAAFREIIKAKSARDVRNIAPRAHSKQPLTS